MVKDKRYFSPLQAFFLYAEHNHLPCTLRYTETIIRTLIYQPDNILSRTHYILVFFIETGKFPVTQIITHFLKATHSERNEFITCLPFTEHQRSGHFRSVQTSDMHIVRYLKAFLHLFCFLMQYPSRGFFFTLPYNQAIPVTQHRVSGRIKQPSRFRIKATENILHCDALKPKG